MRRCAVILLACAGLIGRPQAQVRPIYDRGSAGLTQILQRLTTTASVLHVGAHPDDEDSAFLARTARGDHARVAYLALNRGEGGQNIIGPELFDALGVIRTEELLQARRLDGGEQFFTRAFDFGFSKTRAETASLWDEQAVLEDMVRVIRTFRPLVIYSRFSGTAADGHGHHQMAGYLTPLAFKAAADTTAFPELTREGLRPWQAKKLYMTGGRGGGAGPVLQVPTGDVEPVIGRSYAEIAAEGRSQHKSQEMGSIEPRGPSSSTLRLLESKVQLPGAEQSVFDGIDTTVPALSRLAGLTPAALSAELKTIDAAARESLRVYQPLHPDTMLPSLADGLRATRQARAALNSLTDDKTAVADADFLLAQKEEDFTAAMVRAAEVVLDPLSTQETVEQGTTVDVAVRVFAEKPSLVRVIDTAVHAPDGWSVSPADAARDGGGGGRGGRETPTKLASYRVQVPRGATPTQPYFLETPRRGAMYQWSDTAPRTLPFGPPLLTATATLEIAGVTLTDSAGVMFRTGDPIRGELRRDVNVVPALAVGFTSSLFVLPTGSAAQSQTVQVQIVNLRNGAGSGTLSLKVPAGWSVSPASLPIALTNAGDRLTSSFTVTAPARRQPGRYEIAAEAKLGEGSYTRAMQVIAYPHIQTHRLYSNAVATAEVIDLAVAPVRVGYVMGSGDQVPDALRRMKVPVTLLDDTALATGDLSAFDTIVVGIRASEARPAFVANQARLRQFMERGGTLIVQYQQQEYIARNLPPYPAQMMGNSRVTDEKAPVTILAPQHPAFTFPNRITQSDFEGWVQERNLYSFTSFDAQYVPLLESADAGEMPQRGGEVYARVGKGHYVYSSYAWFRQLPAGVPGAYRMFANLISLGKAPARADSPARGAGPRSGAAPAAAPARTGQSR
jgi:LmbE family N-acetylglucosaminyl deacetylase